MDTVRISVPASTSNLGPGFDTLGLALDWRLVAEISPASSLVIEPPPSSPREWREPLSEMIRHCLQAWQKAAGISGPLKFRAALDGGPPLARGLGSSAVYRVAAASAADHFFGRPLGDQGVLELVSRLEKHTDNATPCLLGGLTASGWDGDRVRYSRLELGPRWRLAALVPELRLPTSEARRVLPESIPRDDAIFNLQRALWLWRALAEDKPEDLRGVFRDKIHQPARTALMPFLPEVIRAAEDAGAFGAFLSGAGSTILAFTDEDRAKSVADAMLAALLPHGPGETRILLPDNRGAVRLD